MPVQNLQEKYCKTLPLLGSVGAAYKTAYIFIASHILAHKFLKEHVKALKDRSISLCCKAINCNPGAMILEWLAVYLCNGV